MQNGLAIWHRLRDSLWFTPAVIVVLAVALAIGLIEVDVQFEPKLVKSLPLLFGAGADGARGMLTAIATSMITVAGVVFSITLVALSLASSQYSSRVLRNFMRDRMNQIVLGVFVGIYAYCLIVLRTIRGGDEGAFVPSMAVVGGVLLAFVGVGYLIYFIHHIATAIQASTILARIAAETTHNIDTLFPDELGEQAGPETPAPETSSLTTRWHAVPARRTGYLTGVDSDGLLKFAREQNAVVRMERAIGDFVIDGLPLASVLTDSAPADDVAARVRSLFGVESRRTAQQDARYGIRQIVDVALKALSPSVNDSTTAVIAVDHLTALLLRLATRRIGSDYRFDDRGDHQLRVIAKGPDFADLTAEALNQIRQNPGGNVAVLERLVDALAMLESNTSHSGRRATLLGHAMSLQQVIRTSIPLESDREPIADRVDRLMEKLRGGAPLAATPGAPPIRSSGAS